MTRMWRTGVVAWVTGFVLAALSLGIVFFCLWLVAVPAVPAWPLDVAAALIAVCWLIGLWLACVRLADYVERPSTVEINGRRVRAYVMRLILPHSHWMALLEDARYDDHPTGPDR